MRRLATGVVIAALAHASDARADDGGSPYRLKLAYDVGLFALGAAGSMTAILGHPKPPCYPGCVPASNMLGIDDASIGNYSRTAHGLASVLVVALVAAPLVLDAADSRFKGWAQDTVVAMEAFILAQAVTQVTKSAVGRTAPFVYNPRAAQDDLDSPDAFRSFISGHSSTAFAAATSYAYTFWKRHPDSPWRWVVLGVGEALATTVALLKVEAGYHYATDVVAGGLVGGAMGILVPTLHAEW